MSQLATRGDETLDTSVHGFSDGCGRLSQRRWRTVISTCANTQAKSLTCVEASRAHLSGSVGIGHTRWAPTGGDRRERTSAHGRIRTHRRRSQRHHRELSVPEEGTRRGRAHLRLRYRHGGRPPPHRGRLEAGADPEDAVREAISRLDGSYAVAVVVAGCDSVFAARNDSPLVLGIDDGATYLASDVPAFRDFTDKVVYLADGEFARLNATAGPYDTDGTVIERTSTPSVGPRGDRQERLRPLHAQGNPRATARDSGSACVAASTNSPGRSTSRPRGPLPDRRPVRRLWDLDHAALHGAQLFREAGIPAQAFLASEYATATPPIGDALVVGVTQSGETADTLRRSARPPLRCTHGGRDQRGRLHCRPANATTRCISAPARRLASPPPRPSPRSWRREPARTRYVLDRRRPAGHQRAP